MLQGLTGQWSEQSGSMTVAVRRIGRLGLGMQRRQINPIANMILPDTDSDNGDASHSCSSYVESYIIYWKMECISIITTSSYHHIKLP